jgi:hypothetical protein
MKLRHISLTLLLAVSLAANAANEKTSVTQVTSAVTLTTDVDYIITGTTPFATGGSVDIQATEHAVVIISSIKPSKVISNWLSHIYINGEQAKNNVNCQVKMYNRGAIVFPYGSDFRPLTCYTEPGYQGEACTNYTEGHSGGFMKSLTASTLNNQIRSFRLKRGYMVTFALGTGGWGYSRCFIADQADLEIASLPANMDARISSYRLFKWHNAHKAGLASNGSAGANQALGTSWCYDWAQGNDSNLPDTEWVPNHIYEDWPSAATCGSVSGSCHMKTNNEPGNSADDHPQSVDVILDNWQNLMRTGMRLCSESSHDGSMNHLKAFIDSIDARGWRCDILDLHCYWNSGTFNSLTWYSDNYGKGRPIWISEWIWGSSWGRNGAFADGVSNTQILNETKNILNVLNNNSRVERYAYWNSESKAHIYEGGALTDLGRYYSTMDDGLGYNPANEYIPKVVYKAPTDIQGTYVKSKGQFVITWNDDNGDMLDSMTVECRLPGSTKFVEIANIELKDKNQKAGANYTFTDEPDEPGAYYYRVASYPIGSKTARYSAEVSTTFSSSKGNDQFQYGKFTVTNLDAITTDFSESFSEIPAIFMGIISNKNASLYPGNLITSAAKNKFNYQLLPWTQQNNAATTVNNSEEIPFMAVKAGNYKYGELDCEVGTAKVNMVDTAEIAFEQPFPEGVTPIVLAELRNPSLKANPIAITIWNVSNTGFKAIIQYEEAIGNKSRVSQTLCYLAVTPGVGSVMEEATGRQLIASDTLSRQAYPIDSQTDSVVYVSRNTYRITYGHTIIAAGTGENPMSGSTYKNCTFVAGQDTLYLQSPKIFGKCQTNNYPAATVLRRQSDITVTDKDSPLYKHAYGTRIKRQVDGTSPAKNTAAFADELGYVVIDSGENTYTTETLEETTSAIEPHGQQPITIADITQLIGRYLQQSDDASITITDITQLIDRYLQQAGE